MVGIKLVIGGLTLNISMDLHFLLGFNFQGQQPTTTTTSVKYIVSLSSANSSFRKLITGVERVNNNMVEIKLVIGGLTLNISMNLHFLLGFQVSREAADHHHCSREVHCIPLPGEFKFQVLSSRTVF
ncbi:hypothetical protein HAX54_050815 [Datura stramonium]|uniref:Transmembrane protein n=1 Tax=Datura stramonium TaxID=4076 RepID=A0ABS8WP33_DATST|nr:hypothetical protein [Datura stramonium]